MSQFRKWHAMAVVGLACALAPSDTAAARSKTKSHQTYTQTRYPIVLVPGVLGFNRLFGVLDYFYGIPAALRESGATVYVVQLDAFNSVEARGEQLLGQLRYISASSGAPKLNVIAHSQGGVDSRYALAARPDLFASLTTVGSPHDGSALADFILSHTKPNGFTREVGGALANALGFFVNLISGSALPQDALGTLQAMSSEGMREFNDKHPAGLPQSNCGEGPAEWNGVALYSWGGTSPVTNPLDPTDGPFGIASLLAKTKNDGIIEHCSTHFGHVIDDAFRLNHGDEINQVLGLTALFGTSPLSLFRAHANRLKGEGL